LSALDASFLYLEGPTAVLHVGSVAVFEPPDRGFEYDQMVALVSARIAYVPRYRQRVRTVPGRLGNPVWVDDANFDLGYHVRRSALPSPGTDQQLAELVARLQSRALDRHRPLWELCFVEGLAGGRFAMISKAHQALVDGVNAVDLAQVILEDSPQVPDVPTDTWKPAPEPTDVELLVGALADAARRPRGVLDAWRGSADDVRQAAGQAVGQLGSVLSAAARSAARPAPTGPLNVQIGEQRRYAMVDTSLADHRAVRDGQARRERQRRGAGHRHRRPARLVADQRGAGAAGHHGASAGADQRGGRRGRRTASGGQPSRRLRGRPTGRRAQPGGPAASGVLRDARPGRGRRRGAG
jgi:diacylglycerol O-acyltransferase / wax synthase